VRFFPLSERSIEAERDTAYYFEFDKSNVTPEMIEMLKGITEAFAEQFGLQDLLEVQKLKVLKPVGLN
jgi:hypothetical protein